MTLKLFEVSPSSSKKEGVKNYNSLKAYLFFSNEGSTWKEGIVRLEVNKVVLVKISDEKGRLENI